MAHLIAPAIEAGLHISEMRLSGPATGAAPGPLSGGASLFAPLIQLRADLFGVPVVIGKNPEASAAGAAALAGVAAGSFATLVEASHAVSAPALRVEPDPQARERARELVHRYGALASATGVSGAGRRED